MGVPEPQHDVIRHVNISLFIPLLAWPPVRLSSRGQFNWVWTTIIPVSCTCSDADGITLVASGRLYRRGDFV